eukprot:8721507-Lingulodinium_polyedra.AAC.1
MHTQVHLSTTCSGHGSMLRRAGLETTRNCPEIGSEVVHIDRKLAWNWREIGGKVARKSGKFAC